MTETVTASAPAATETVEAHGNTTVAQCPENSRATYSCPERTGVAIDSTDPAYNHNFISCPVLAEDDFSGRYKKDFVPPLAKLANLGGPLRFYDTQVSILE